MKHLKRILDTQKENLEPYLTNINKMTPKEKAKELYESLSGIHDSINGEKIYFTHDTIKKALTLTVDEVKESLITHHPTQIDRVDGEKFMYWQEVNQEIKKI